MLKHFNGDDRQNVKSDVRISMKEKNNGERAPRMIFSNVLTNHFYRWTSLSDTHCNPNFPTGLIIYICYIYILKT